MYLDQVFDDTFFLLLLIVISGFFLYIGWRNYRDPDLRKPASPLGRYLLKMAIKQPDTIGDEIRKAEVTRKIVLIDAGFALIAGSTILLTMGVALIIGLLLR